VVDIGNDGSVTSVVKAECSSGAHHWVIQKPDGPISEGVCKWCNAHRDFTNEVTRRYTSQNRLSQGSPSAEAR
jgi:hypothetical protein